MLNYVIRVANLISIHDISKYFSNFFNKNIDFSSIFLKIVTFCAIYADFIDYAIYNYTKFLNIHHMTIIINTPKIKLGWFTNLLRRESGEPKNWSHI